MKTGLKAWDGALELAGTAGLATLILVPMGNAGTLNATPIDTTSLWEYIKSFAVDSAGDISWTNVIVTTLSAVASFGDNFWLWRINR